MKTNRKAIVNLILALSFVILVLSFQASYSASTDKAPQFKTGVKTQLCMVLDGSGSIRSTEWDTILQGISKAINTTTPRDGSVELTIVQFGYDSRDGYTKTEIPPTVIDSANHGMIVNRVLTITQGGSGTPMAHGLYLGWKEISDSPNFEPATKQIINLATDGEPSRRNNYATSDLDGDGHIDHWDDVIAVVNNAVDQGLEELDIEGIGITNSSRDWFKKWTVHPQPGILAPPFSKPGWIRVVANATEFANSIDQKLQLVIPEETYTLMVDIVGNGSVAKDPDQATYACNTTVEVTAIPDSCYEFDHWELDGENAGTINPIEVLMNSNHTLHAIFRSLTYNLTISTTAGGTTDPTPGTHTYVNGTAVSITATPDINYEFEYWVLDGANAGSDNPIDILMDSNHNLQAVFTQITCQLTIATTTGGTTNPEPGNYTYVNGTVISVTAIPNAKNVFHHWELDDSSIGSDNPVDILMDENHMVLTVFALRTYTLTITSTAGGTTDPVPGTYIYTAGSSANVNAIPDSGWSFSHWSGDLSGSADAETITIDVDKTVTAHFTQKQYALTINIVGNGFVIKNPDQTTYPHGTVVELTATADPGWTFSHWSGNLTGSTNPNAIILDANKTVTAHFTQDQIWAPSLRDAAATGVATVAMTSTLAAMSSSLTNPAASVGSSFWSRIAAALPDSLQNLLQSYGEEILASKTQKEIEEKEVCRLLVTPTEVLALVLGAATLTFCFSYAIAGATSEILSVVPIAFATVVVVELAYWLTMEVVARGVGVWSEYHVWPIGITMLIVFTLAFRSPFCVAGRSKFQCAKPTKRSFGLISLSGPVVCLLLGGVFALLLAFGYEQVGSLGVMVCIIKATFDLIPTPPMSGKEIFDWNKIIWLMLFLPSAASYLFFILNF